MKPEQTTNRDRADAENISEEETALLQSINNKQRPLSSIKREQPGSMGELRTLIYKLRRKGMLQITEEEEQMLCKLTRRGHRLMENRAEQKERTPKAPDFNTTFTNE